MPIIKSAKKRVKVTAKATARNALLRRQVRDSLKAYSKALDAGKADKVAETQRNAVKALDNAAKHAVIHKNKAARKKAQLAQMAKAKGLKPVKLASKAKPVAKKPAAKK